MKVDDPRVRKLYEYLARINQTAYHDDYLLTTEVLSKSPFCRSILPTFLAGRPAPGTTLFSVLKKIILFYVKSAGWYLVQLGKLAAHVLSRQKYRLNPDADSLTLIDILFYTKNIISDKDYRNIHFPGLEEVLIKQGKTYAYTTKFFDSSNPFELFKVFKILRKNKRPVLTEFQLLKFCDYALALKFLFTYPLHVVRLIKQLGNDEEDRFLRVALWDTLDRPALLNYFQLLYGRRISLLPVSNIKCISWFENQPREKSFYKGLRFDPGKVVIYGAQLYVWPSNLGSIDPEEREISFGVVPDKIVVNGTYYLPEQSSIDYRVGPSLRSGRIFQVQANPSASKIILVLMPYFEEEMEKVLDLVNGMNLTGPMVLKFHPAVNWRKFAGRIRKDIEVVEGDLFDFLVKSRMVIGKATSTLVEAASLGIPAICIESDMEGRSEFSHSFMPELGKGIIWDSARTPDETVDRISKFDGLLDREPGKIAEIGQQYKRMFFSQPSDQKIIEAFDLN